MRKKTFTLLEVIIAIFLLGTVLTGLMRCYQQTIKTQIKARALKSNVHRWEVFHQRLQQLFEHATALSLEGNAAVLSISYAKALDRNPNFCKDLSARLSLDAKGALVLTTCGKNKETREEIFLEKVQKIHFEFFDSKAKKWVNEWPQKRKELPEMVKLHCQQHSKDKSLVYFLYRPEEPLLL